MCGRYVVKAKIEIIEKAFNLRFTEFDKERFRSFAPNFNVAPGDFAPVITNENPKKLQFYRFGYAAPWSNKRMFVINARTEGDQNKDNDPKYTGGPGILKKKFWRDAVHNRRCIIFADAFFEGPEKEKLKKPYLVYLLHKKAPFAFAGVWSHWVDPDTGEQIGTFAILTHVANSVCAKIGHHRSPVILTARDAHYWIRGEGIAGKMGLLKPYPGHLMNAYPIDPNMLKLDGKSRKPKYRDVSVINPVGQRIFPEMIIRNGEKTYLEGMGRRTGFSTRQNKDEIRKEQEFMRKFEREDDPGFEGNL